VCGHLRAMFKQLLLAGRRHVGCEMDAEEIARSVERIPAWEE